MDEKDFEAAAEMTEMIFNDGLHRVRVANMPESHPDFDEVHCIECGDDMPPERLALRRIRCTLCQTLLEKKAKRR